MFWLGLEAIDLVLRVDNLASGGVRAKGYAIVLEAIVATKVILRAQALCTLENTATFLSSKGCNDISASPLHKLDQSSMLIHRRMKLDNIVRHKEKKIMNTERKAQQVRSKRSTH